MAKAHNSPVSTFDSIEQAGDASGPTQDKRPMFEQWGLRDRRVPKALPPFVSDERNGMYFEVYRVPETHLTAILRSGGDWRWHFCSADGSVEVTSGSYPTESACISSIEILRGGAGDADLLRPER